METHEEHERALRATKAYARRRGKIDAAKITDYLTSQGYTAEVAAECIKYMATTEPILYGYLVEDHAASVLPQQE